MNVTFAKTLYNIGGTEVIARCIDDNGNKKDIILQMIYGDVVAPTGTVPGYGLFLGQLEWMNVFRRHTLLFLREVESPSQGELFEKLTDICAELQCQTIYADRGMKAGAGFYRDLWKYLSHTNVRLKPAPSADDENYGLVLIQELLRDEALDIPTMTPTTLRSQLKNMTGDSDRSGLYAFHALRYLITGFVRNPYMPSSISVPRARNWETWT